ncbi:MAG TPA: hypothetical protein VK509_10945, partial [Polyangiales bacterium]|nr:hypothetical protein [Polyangiales bacterium]
PEWSELSQNHLEGRTAAFFCYGDNGADEGDESGGPKKLLHREYFDPEREPFANPREAYAPLVWQCRYSGIEVPDQLWRFVEFGHGEKYSDNQAEHLPGHPLVEQALQSWVTELIAFVERKGKVPPGRHRAFGYRPPRHVWADLKLAWREVRMRTGHPPPRSSPALQQQQGLNRDVTLTPGKGEGEKERERE